MFNRAMFIVFLVLLISVLGIPEPLDVSAQGNVADSQSKIEELLEAIKSGDKNRIKRLRREYAELQAGQKEDPMVTVWRQLMLANAEITPARALRSSAKAGHASVVQWLVLVTDVDVNAADQTDGSTALHLAIEAGKIEVAKILIRAGADFEIKNRNGDSPADLTTREIQNEWLAIRAINQELDRIDRPLQLTESEEKVYAALKERLNQGPISDASMQMAMAGFQGYDGVVNLLLENHASPNGKLPNGDAALHLAVEHGQLNVVRSLMEYGANANILDASNRTPLHRISKFSNDTMIRVLMKANAKIEAKDAQGRTPLHLATESGSLEVVRALLMQKANSNATDNQGNTPLHLASAATRREILIELLRFGGDPRVKNSKQQSVADVAPNKHLATYLRKFAEIGPVKSSNSTDAETKISAPSTNPKNFVDAIVKVGHPDDGWVTGFVVSNEHRLVVTIAKASDLLHFRNAIFVKTSNDDTIKAARVRVHPGVLRQVLGSKSQLVRSLDPADGFLVKSGPNVAILKLEQSPINFSELKISLPKTWDQLGPNQTGEILTCNSKGGGAQKVHQPSIHLEREINLHLSTTRERFGCRMFRTSREAKKNERGAPILVDGAVVAMIVESPFDNDVFGKQQTVAFALPARTILEAIIYHGFEEQIPQKFESNVVDLKRYRKPDPGLTRIRSVVRGIEKANAMIVAKDYDSADQVLNELEDLASGFSSFYIAKARLHTMRIVQPSRSVTDAFRRQEYSKAEEAARKIIEITPDDTFAILIAGTTRNNFASSIAKSEPSRAIKIRRELVELCDQTLNRPDLNRFEKAEAYNLRAGVKTGLLDFRGAQADFANAISLNPKAPIYYLNRAIMWRLSGNMTAAKADEKMAANLKNK